MERIMKNFRRQENGQIAILLAMILPVVFLFISASSTATAIEIGEVNFVALNPTECNSLVVNANDTFIVEGSILVNSECDNAAVFGCNSSCQALSGIHSVGGYDTTLTYRTQGFA